MYTTPNGKLVVRDPAAYIGPPGFNSHQSPFANIDYGVVCDGARGSRGGGSCVGGVAFPSAAMRAQQYCFEPAFVTRGSKAPGLTETCLYTATSDRVSSSALAESFVARRQGHGGSDFCSGVPHVTKVLSAGEYKMFAQAASSGAAQNDLLLLDDQADTQDLKFMNPQRTGMLLIDDGTGQQVIACPVPVDPHVDNQYQQAFLDVWQPNRFAETNKPEAYAMTSDIRDQCFFKDATYPNGTTLPLAVRMTPKCLAAADAAIAQIGPSVGSRACCTLYDPRR